jgi:hypothetical protein
VVGDGGLVALAWHAKFERFGAPQVVRRSHKARRAPMDGARLVGLDGGKALIAAAVPAPRPRGRRRLCQALAKAELDGSKGVAMSFRPWDGQLRQPLLLTDGQGVIAQRPDRGHPAPEQRARHPGRRCAREAVQSPTR